MAIRQRMSMMYIHGRGSEFYSSEASKLVSNFKLMLRKTPLPKVMEFGKILTELKSLKDFDNVIDLSKEMYVSGIKPNNVTNTILINCYGQLNEMRSCFCLLGDIIKRGYNLTPVTINSMLKAFCDNKRVDEALEFKNQIVSKGYEVNSIGQSILIDGLCGNGKTREALRLIKFSAVKDLTMYNSIIKGFCRERCMVDAFKFLEKMIEKSVFPDIITYNSLIYGLCISGESRRAFELFSSLRSKQITPDVITLSTLVNYLCKELRIIEAECFIGSMFKRGVTPNTITYNNWIRGLFLVGQIEEAKKVFYSMPQIDIPCYTLMINGLCKSNMLMEALDLFKEAQGINLQPDSKMYRTLIDSLCYHEIGIDQAFKFFEEMPDPLKSFSYIYFIRVYCNVDRVGDALAFIDRMFERNVAPSLSAYTRVVDALCRLGDVQAAKQICDGLLAKGWRLDVVIYSSLVKGMCCKYMFEEARALLRTMEKEGCPPNMRTYVTIINVFSKDDRNREGEEMLHEMSARLNCLMSKSGRKFNVNKLVRGERPK